MSTEYALSIGYMGGDSANIEAEEAYQALKTCVEQLRDNPEHIVTEARRLNAPETCKEGCCTLLEMAKAYQMEQLGPLVFCPDEYKIVQLTTGDRTLKEHIRRAFCRLVIEGMHRQGIEVNLTVS